MKNLKEAMVKGRKSLGEVKRSWVGKRKTTFKDGTVQEEENLAWEESDDKLKEAVAKGKKLLEEAPVDAKVKSAVKALRTTLDQKGTWTHAVPSIAKRFGVNPDTLAKEFGKTLKA